MDPNSYQDLALIDAYFLQGRAPTGTRRADLSYEAAVQQYHEGMPVAYLLGDAPFFDRLVFVAPGVLIPRPETEGLVQAACTYIGAVSVTHIADVGYGTGCIALEMARRFPNASICGWDISPIAYQTAQRNCQKLDSETVTLYRQDVFEAIASGSMIQSGLIISNPPYVNMQDSALAKTVQNYEPRIALDGGDGGLAWIQKFLMNMASAEHQQLFFALEIGYDQGQRVRDMMTYYGYKHIQINSDLSGQDRYALGQLT
ncbi:protein-(glutamine-N5) methyltransferase, release factor-specific [bacterium]|nr:protein-(glutamine-N5) methyltransferase, release factor-specific [bacterium]